ncbi:solute symporter family protein [Natrarchaeobaculum sulfurireducens]|uniref:Acetate permease ActP (Cation/acetate symporter) n=1 Tax=Natrarchaeobaculum sulfurireducens TaxID=2044521 RepID=A0A346PET9_9EURY|nr:cation acetate symporter [Natrarchaeobaculum sulfurireducens]AXR78034.1 Sodium:solute symporter [Natrarchaeobaculum sulfurireducens]AXR81977.1 Acetate permease ActP (cation/acetate symporter) [Natrarchaeobaculum sulfurireducens]
MIEPVLLEVASDLFDGGFKLFPALTLVAMLTVFLGVGWFFRVAAVDDMWVAGRSIGAVENGMAIAANWMSVAAYLGVASTVALLGYFGLAYVVGWTTGYFILLIFLAAQFRRFGKYTAPDFVGDRYYSDLGRAIAASTTLLIAFVYIIAQGNGLGLMAQYIFGVSYEVGVILLMTITIGYVALSGMLGATKNMALQYVILISAFLLGLYATGLVQGWSTALPFVEYGNQATAMAEIERQYTEPFANASYYHWIALCVSLIAGTCGLPHVLVRFYTADNERNARWATVWGLFFTLLLFLGTAAYAAFGSLLYQENVGEYTEMTGTESDTLVVLTAYLAGLPEWLVGIVAAGAIAAGLATTAGLFISASSAAAHDIYTNLYKSDATPREQLIVGRLTILSLGAVVTVLALNPPALIAEVVGMSFALAGTVLFPVFFLGLWWEDATREGAIAGMFVGLFFGFGSILNEILPQYIGALSGDAIFPAFAAIVPATSSSLVGVPAVVLTIVVVSQFTEEPPEDVKRLVRQCHSPEPMAKLQSAEEVATDGGTPEDD